MVDANESSPLMKRHPTPISTIASGPQHTRSWDGGLARWAVVGAHRRSEVVPRDGSARDAEASSPAGVVRHWLHSTEPRHVDVGQAVPVAARPQITPIRRRGPDL